MVAVVEQALDKKVDIVKNAIKWYKDVHAPAIQNDLIRMERAVEVLSGWR